MSLKAISNTVFIFNVLTIIGLQSRAESKDCLSGLPVAAIYVVIGIKERSS